MNETLYQIGLPIENLSTVLMNWTCYDPQQKILISPSSKTADLVVVETRHFELAAAIIRDIPAARLAELKQPVKIVKL